VTRTEASFTGSRGVRIAWRSWLPPGPPRALVVVVHGAGEHSGRYEHVAAALVSAGYGVSALDHRGHGRSEGTRALIERVDHAVADVDQLVGLALDANPGAQVFVLGHSMGGLIALRYALAHQDRLAGLILSGTLAAIEDVPAALRMLGRLLSTLAPATPLIAIDPELVSRDPAVVAAYRSDPLVHHGKLPARTAAEIADAVERLASTVGDIHLPTLVLYGTADGLCPPAGSVMLGERIGSSDITVKAYDGLFHEILNEPERAAVLDDVLAWLDARVGAGARDPAGSVGS
jgi:acylglycerol lipase